MPLSPWDMSVRRSWFWVGWKTVPFSPFVDQSSPNMVREWSHYAAPFSTIRYLVPIWRYLHSAIKSQNGVVKNTFSAQNFFGRKTPKIRCGHLMPLRGAIRGMYRQCKSAVRSTFGEGFWFEVMTGVRQGSVLSPLLFILLMDQVLKQVQMWQEEIIQTHWLMQTMLGSSHVQHQSCKTQ